MNWNRNSQKYILVIIFFSICLLVSIILLIFFIYQPQQVTSNEISKPTTTPRTIIGPSAYDDMSLDAQAVYVLDVKTHKVLFSKNAETPLPLASITKIMTAIAASDLLSPTSTITIDQNALKPEGDSGLYVGEEWTFKNLLDFSLVMSSNDGVAAIAEAAGNTLSSHSAVVNDSEEKRFIDYMNQKATTLHLSNTHFYNESGLDLTTTESGAYGSAKDVALLLKTAIEKYPGAIAATRYDHLSITSKNNITHEAHNTDDAINIIPGIIASKTGYTDLAGGNLVIAFDAGLQHPIVISVLGSSYNGRFKDMVILVQRTLRYYTFTNNSSYTSQ